MIRTIFLLDMRTGWRCQLTRLWERGLEELRADKWGQMWEAWTYWSCCWGVGLVCEGLIGTGREDGRIGGWGGREKRWEGVWVLDFGTFAVFFCVLFFLY